MTWNNHLLLIFIFTSIISIYSDELSDLNKKFISTYEHARDYLISITNPLIICNGDNVIIIHRGKRYQEQVIPKLYHDLKSMSHMPFKIYLTVMFNLGTLSDDNYTELKQYLQDIRSIRNSMQFPTDIQQTQYDIIDLSIEYLETILKTKFIDQTQLNEFCQQARHLFSVNIDLAARAQLDMLDTKMRPWYEERFNDTERNTLKILIMGSKTARDGYIEKTYFYTLLGERQEGNHIIFVEDIGNEQRALEILGVWLLDAKASASFFSGDSERLHRDVLADAGVAHIKRIFKTSKSEL
ncbi:unnamed protein product [Adineta steineri]|uniref:Uncharacterized protein n=1 Tax=Adineta steineri TaxID=433720 RepID=A0A819RD74_9BILA|nr:unnamed protein product [Adineta steineri]